MAEENENKKPTYLDELRAEKADLIKLKDEATAIVNSLEQFKQEKIIAGSAGGHIEAEPAKVETPKEYANRVLNNKVELKP
jgi:hypothetical protein